MQARPLRQLALTDNPNQEPHHRCTSFSMRLFQTFGARPLDFFDLLLDEQ
jgi:hypothetical protein